MRILITGGTTFVSKYAAVYFAEQGYDVYVLNRNSKRQIDGVTLIEADRHKLGDKIRDIRFDAVLDITAYDAADIEDLFNALGLFGQYVMVSSSAVYPEYAKQPFVEDEETTAEADRFIRNVDKTGKWYLPVEE
ncbi:MAG: NAD-dependent epimerase/dehydratase family protein [Saccharofermentans sp.]|nr:NAD-dependent epimerase/dehydratase family protein [Saccharofermentans sp.]